MSSMLPQPNSAPRISDLQEVALHVQGQDDGVFNTQDFILFFGQGPDAYQLVPDKEIFYYQNNLFSDKNYYFFTIGTSDGLRVTALDNVAGNFPVVSGFDDFSYYETEQYNDLHSGRDWFGEQFDSKTSYTIRFQIPGILDGTPVKLVSNVMGQSFAPSSFQLSLNGVSIGEQTVAPIINSQYAVKGSETTDTLTLASSQVHAATQTNQDLTIKFTKAATGRSIGYLDFVLLQTRRNLALYGDQTLFQSLGSLDNTVSQFQIQNIPATGFIWDVTDPFHPKQQTANFESGKASFNAPSSTLHKYLALSNKTFPTPVVEGAVQNQSIRSITSVDLLIVTAPDFLSDAMRLASYRQTKNGIRVSVVTTAQVYNEFSGGKQDVTAIRDFVRYLYDQKTGIKNLLLFGRGSYDYKNYLPYNKNFVPTYESRNSLSPLETYSSDDYFGFLEAGEGNWGEKPAEDHTLEIGIGRLPVKKVDEAKLVVDKIIEYENQSYGDWRKKILFVADDGDDNIHQGQADELAETVESLHGEFNALKIYVDNFKQVGSSIGQVSPDATQALARTISSGVAVVNYTGHGNEQQWMQERIVDQVSLDKWKSAPHYPLLVTATCEFGRNDDPGMISTAELSLLHKGGGSIGLLTTARPVNSATNFFLNKAFYQALFVKEAGRFRDLGSVIRDTKNNSLSGVANRNFSLLGDPSMHVILPAGDLRITSIKNLTSGSDTLKGLSTLQVSGTVMLDGVPDTGYNGTLSATVFDKAASEKTKGDENQPFPFLTHDNPVFNGQASIQHGQFTFQFTLPASINPLVGTSKISLYGSPASSQRDVAGVHFPIKIGSLEKNPGIDTKAPTLDLYMGDTTYTAGGIVGTDSRIVAILSDEHGINISNFDPAHAILAVLDDSVSMILTDYYRSDVNHVQRGKVSYPLFGLKPGNHRLVFSASDVYGNRATATLPFTVSDQTGIQVEEWLAYPNPFASLATFHFKHNRSGEDLEAVVTVYNPVGQPLISNTYEVLGSEYQVDLPPWDGTTAGGTKLSPGLYLLKLSVRSLVDGSKNEKITKVIISN